MIGARAATAAWVFVVRRSFVPHRAVPCRAVRRGTARADGVPDERGTSRAVGAVQSGLLLLSCGRSLKRRRPAMANARRRGPANWQIAALATAGGLGALALANRLSSAAAGQTHTVLEGQQRRYTWTHGDIFYAVKGRGEPVVLVHGVYAGASSFEFRRVFDRLAERYRVYAFDLLGFGLSERPAILYTPEIYIRLIQDFVRQVVGGMDHPVRVIASTLGAAFTIRAADEHPSLFDRLALIEPTGIQDLASPPDTLAR